MNPFKFGTIVEDEFFTDRVNELEQIKQMLDSENHLVLISPRRFGKSSLVAKALQQIGRPSITIDFMKVLNVEDLAAQVLRQVFRLHKFEKVKHFMKHFRVVPTLSYNPMTDGMDVSFVPSVGKSSAMLEDSLELLEKVSFESRLPKMPASQKASITEEILKFTDVHPYYTQQLAAAVYNALVYGKITENVVVYAVKRQVEEHSLDYERLWANMNRTDRKVMLSLANKKNPITDRSVPTSTSFSSIKRLLKQGYVIKTVGYELEDPFFGEWILEN